MTLFCHRIYALLSLLYLYVKWTNKTECSRLHLAFALQWVSDGRRNCITHSEIELTNGKMRQGNAETSPTFTPWG